MERRRKPEGPRHHPRLNRAGHRHRTESWAAWPYGRRNRDVGKGSPLMETVPILTVGDLKSELSRWSDDTPVTLYSPLREQEFRFYRYRPGASALVLEI